MSCCARQREMRSPLLIRLRQEIAAPDSVARHRPRHAMFHMSSRFVDQVLMRPTPVRDVRVADRHLSAAVPSPIEVMRNRPAAGLRHEHFQSNNFMLHPFRLRLCAEYLRPRGLPGPHPSSVRGTRSFTEPAQDVLKKLEADDEHSTSWRQHGDS